MAMAMTKTAASVTSRIRCLQPYQLTGKRYISSKLAAPRIQTGLIKKVQLHPDAENLYMSTISVGEDNELTVISGLRQFYTEQQLQGRKVTLLTNLKPSKLRGITSQAMVLAASSPSSSTVELVNPPVGSTVGDYLKFEGSSNEQPKPVMKSKLWRSIQENLATNDQLQVEYRDPETLHVYKLCDPNSGQPCSVDSIRQGSVS